MMKSHTRPATSARIGFPFRLWWLLAFLAVALPLGTVIQVWRTILPPSDCEQRGDTAHSGAVVQFCFPSLTPQYGQGNITIGPDGNVWFSELNKIARITPTGQLAEFPAQSIYSPLVTGLIVSGPDGNLWFLEGNAVVRMSPDGASEAFGTDVIDSPTALTVGSDKNLWLGNTVDLANKTPTIVKLTTAGEVTSFSLPSPSQVLPDTHPSAGVIDMTAGADGNLWFLENVALSDPPTTQSILLGSITPSGVIKQAPVEVDRGTGPALGGGIGFLRSALTSGSDGNVWFLRHDGQIGRITPSGVITRFQVPGQTAQEMPMMTKASDGNVWFSAPPGQIGRITPKGDVKLFPLPAHTQVGGLAATQMVTSGFSMLATCRKARSGGSISGD
jgi:streptogramin lyase